MSELSRAGGGSGVHWFVAWRYLLSDPRQLSRSIAAMIGLCGWIIVGFGIVAIWLFPLSHPILSPFQPLPWWLPIAFSVATVGALFAPLVSGRPLVILGFAGLIAGVVVLIERRTIAGARAIPSGPTHPAPYGLFAGLGSGLLALALVGALHHLRRPFTDPPGEPVPGSFIGAGIGVAILVVLVLPNALAWYGRRRTEPKRTGERVHTIATRWFGYLLTALSVAALLALAGAALFGVKAVVIPAHSSVTGGKALLAAGLVIAGLGALGLLVSPLLSADRSRAFWAALRALVVGVGLLAMLALLAMRNIALDGMPSGQGIVAKLPTTVTLPILVAFSILVLSVALLGIRYVFTFFSTVSIGGVAIGAMALVIVLSVMSGFENDLRRKILGSNAHVLITKANDKPLICMALPKLGWRRCVLDIEGVFSEYRDLVERIEKVPGVFAASPYLISEVVIAANNNYANVIIKGVDPETVGRVSELGENVRFESGEIDRDALKRLWPLAEDATVIGRPDQADIVNDEDDVDGDGFSDAIPDDPTPIDFSGDGDGDGDGSVDGGAAAPPADDDLADDDLADDDLADDDPIESDSGPVPILKFPPLATGTGDIIDLDLDLDGEFVRHIPPLVAILPGTLVGKELVKQISLYEGQEVKIVSPLGQDTPLGPVPRTKRFRVAGTFFTGMYEYDLKYIYIEVGALQDFLDLGDEVTGIEVRVKDPSDSDDVVAGLRDAIGPEYRIQDWKEINRSLFSALKLEKIAMFLVLAIIILVASFSIVGNLIMVVIEKAREIAVLKTLGTTDVGIMKIFITQGFFIGLVGTAIGVSLGLAACIGMQTFGLPLNPDVYYIDRLPVHIEPLSVGLVFGAGIFISVIATLYPAYVASRMRPVQGLRYE